MLAAGSNDNIDPVLLAHDQQQQAIAMAIFITVFANFVHRSLPQAGVDINANINDDNNNNVDTTMSNTDVDNTDIAPTFATITVASDALPPLSVTAVPAVNADSTVVVGPVGHGGEEATIGGVAQGQPLIIADQAEGQVQAQGAIQGAAPYGLTLRGLPARHRYRRRAPVPPANARRVLNGRGGTGEYITTVERDPAAPGLEAPGLSCTNA